MFSGGREMNHWLEMGRYIFWNIDWKWVSTLTMFFVLSILFMWSLHVRVSWGSTPQNFMLAFLLSSTSSIFSIGKARGSLSFEYFTYVCVSGGKKWFLENLKCFVLLKHPFWESPFCLITDVLWYRENSILNDNLFTLNHLYSFFAVLNLP